MPTFSASISAWVKKSRQRIDAVARGSAQDVARGVTKPVAKGGHMRVDTGFLRASFMASTSSMPQINPYARPPSDAPEGSYSPSEDDVSLVIAGWDAGREVLFLGFTASYAIPREYEDGFVRLEVQKWQETVNRNASKAIRAFP
ncbi:hypothetical protein MXMO3_01821 [Maritalea myrionectae]|uniref:HK97 gp10 family phage protein n=1 Tax=Maritalea myrionectae TaxID=454601 RepID=A0A2R4MEN2_9HYPH|nr:HK97 gp10 family phage protein [Maritalea myrionectae]AVX04346.1 hypothetical protein MXMO3_01821 [Maritalea myrionectae]